MIVLLLGDLAYSFLQHYHHRLDGDIAPIVLPTAWYEEVLADPFGFRVLLKGEKYAATNRYFSHQSMVLFFRRVPLALQYFTDPVRSIYLACAIFKTLLQVILLWLLAAYCSETTVTGSKNLLLAAVLLTPMFQTYGYNNYFGLIHGSVTYAFFYTLSLTLLLLFFLPFYKTLVLGEEWSEVFSARVRLRCLLLMIFLSFQGPLVPPIVLLICPVMLGYCIRQIEATPKGTSILATIRQMPKDLTWFFAGFIGLSLYSYYIGMYNLEQSTAGMPLTERYVRLLEGAINLISKKIGFPLFMAFLLLNLGLLWKIRENAQARTILQRFKYVFAFSVVYTLLLPLGGYREYRPNIMAADTIMPVTISLFYLYGLSSLFLLKYLAPRLKPYYYSALGILLLVFTVADEPNFQHHTCEKEALYTLARSSQDIIALDQDCLIMSWVRINTPAESAPISEMLQYWRVTEERKLFYQE